MGPGGFVGLGAMEVDERRLRDSVGNVEVPVIALMDAEERWEVLVFLVGG